MSAREQRGAGGTRASGEAVGGQRATPPLDAGEAPPDAGRASAMRKANHLAQRLRSRQIQVLKAVKVQPATPPMAARMTIAHHWS